MQTFSITMSFGGPIDSMINSCESNLKQIGKRKMLKEIESEFKASKKPELKFKQLSKNEWERFQAESEQNQLHARRRLYLIIGITLIITLSILYWVINSDYSEIN